MRNRAQCALCRDIIESKHHYDFQQCLCGAIFVDGGTNPKTMLWGGDPRNIIRLKDLIPPVTYSSFCGTCKFPWVSCTCKDSWECKKGIHD